MPARGIGPAKSVLAAAALFIAACTGSSTFDTAVSGNYTLTTINAHTLPYVLPGTPAGTTATVKDGSLTLATNGRFTEVLHTVLVTPDSTIDAHATTIGDASASGGTITFKPHFESTFTGTYTANTVTITRQPSATVTLTYVFERNAGS